MFKNTAYSSLCIFIFIMLQKWFSQDKSSERFFSLFWCLINMNAGQQEY